MYAESLPRHFCDEGWDSAARNQTLRDNTKFIYETGNHEPATVRQRFQGFTHHILRRLINKAKLSIAVFGFPSVAIGKNPARTKRDHTHFARSQFFLKPQREICQKRFRR